MFRNSDARRPAGAEYGVQPPGPQPSSRPAPQGYAPGAAPVQHVADQLDSLLGAAERESSAPALRENEVVFSKPYRAHDETVTRITLRRPTTREIKVCGSPLRIVSGPDGRVLDIEMKWDVVAKYIPLLSSPPLPPSTVDDLDYFDLDACGAVLAPFFVRLTPSGT